MRIALAQIAPVWLQRAATLDKVAQYLEQAASEKADLIVFGEALVPGYPFWLDVTDGARFNSDFQKDMHAHYLQEGVCLEAGHLDKI